MADAYLKVKDNGAQGLALVREETETSVSELKTALGERTRNLFDRTQLRNNPNITYTNNEIYGTSNDITGIRLLTESAYEANTQYTVSLSAYVEASSGTTAGLLVLVYYTDATYDQLSFLRGTLSYARNAITSASGKTIDYVVFAYNAGKNDVWHIKDIQIEKGTVATEYVPYMTANDIIAENYIKRSKESNINHIVDYSNLRYVTGNTLATQFRTDRIAPTEFIPIRNGDIIKIKNGSGFSHAWRMWKGTAGDTTLVSNLGGAFTDEDEEIQVLVDGYFMAQFQDAIDSAKTLNVADFDGSITIYRRELLSELIKNSAPTTQGLAYSWWVNNRVVDSYGNLYFGYISEEAKVGVGCRFPDGTIYRRDLFASEENDDHNAPSIILLTIDDNEYVCVIGSTGHNTDNRINVFVATEPNSILCGFNDRTHVINAPEGYEYECSYSQAYFDGNRNNIYNFFRIKQKDIANGTYVMIWMCAISNDFGETWSIYRVFSTGQNSELFYMWSCDVNNNNYMKRIVLQTNTTNTTVRSIRTGIIDCNGLNIYSGSGFNADNINKPMTLIEDGELAYDPNVTIANYDDFSEVIHAEDGEYYRYRILDVWPGDRRQLHFLFAKSVENVQDHHDITDWILYRYNNADFQNHPSDGVVTEIAHLGLPYFVGSSYVTGACYVNNTDGVVYSKNDSPSKDGKHSLHYVEIQNNEVINDEIKKVSSQTLARPARYDTGSIMFLQGKYREGSGTAYLTWHFGIGFIDSF